MIVLGIWVGIVNVILVFMLNLHLGGILVVIRTVMRGVKPVTRTEYVQVWSVNKGIYMTILIPAFV